MELVFNGNKFVVSVDGQRAAAVYCVNYAEGRYDVVFNDDVVEQNPLPIFEQLLVNASERVPVLESNEANTWRYFVPNPVLDMSSIQAHFDGDKIRFFDNHRELFYAVLTGEDMYNIIETAPTELRFCIDLPDFIVSKFVELFNDSRHARMVDGSVMLSYKGSVEDMPLDAFHVNATGHGRFAITTATAGAVGTMTEMELSNNGVNCPGVSFTSYNGTPFPAEWCRAIYQRTTHYSLGECQNIEQQRYYVIGNKFAYPSYADRVRSTVTDIPKEDTAWISIKAILPSVLFAVNGVDYIVMPVYVDHRDCGKPHYGNVVYRGETISKGWVDPRGYVCMPATRALIEQFGTIRTSGYSSIPVSVILVAFDNAADLQPELYVSPFDTSDEDSEPRLRRRNYTSRDRSDSDGISRGSRRGR